MENDEGNNGQLVFITADENILNAIDYNGVIHIPGTKSKVLYTGAAATFQVAGADDLRPIYTAGETGEADTMSLVLPDRDSYTLTTGDKDLSYSLYAGDCFLTAAADAPGEVTFWPEGAVGLSSDSGSYALSVTVNDSPLTWDTVELRGDRAADVTLRLTEEGAEITAAQPGTVTLTGTDDSGAHQRTFTLTEQTALVKDVDGEPALFLDTDGDGDFETDASSCYLSGTDRKDGTVDVTVNNPTASGKAQLIAARYDGQGKMLACTARDVTLTAGESVTVSLDLKDSGSGYQETRLFLTDAGSAPLCSAGRAWK